MIDSIAVNTRYLDASAPSAQQALGHTFLKVPKLCSDNRNNRLFFGIIIIDYDYEEDNHNRLYNRFDDRLIIDYFLFLATF